MINISTPFWDIVFPASSSRFQLEPPVAPAGSSWFQPWLQLILLY